MIYSMMNTASGGLLGLFTGTGGGLIGSIFGNSGGGGIFGSLLGPVDNLFGGLSTESLDQY